MTGSRLLSALYASLALAVLLPVMCVRVAGLGDTLNHLARMHVLASIGRSPELQRYYEVSWAPIPYLAMDALLPLLVSVMPVYAAGKLFVGACLLMPPAAVAVLRRVVHGRVGVVPVAAFLLSYNQLVSLGFLNYLFSSGLAVMLFAGWVGAAGWPRWRRSAAFAPLVVLLYLGHVFACLGYCLCIAGWEATRAVCAGFRPARQRTADVAAALAQAVPALVMAARLKVGAGYVGQLHTMFGGVAEKLVALASPLVFLPDLPGLAVLGTVCLLALLLAPRLRLAPGLWPAAALIWLASLAVPHLMDSTWGTDLRLPLVAAMLTLGALSWRPGAARVGFVRISGLAAVLLLVCVTSVDAWTALRAADRRIAETRRVLAGLPPGARLLVVNAARGHERDANPSTIWNLPLVAVIDHDAFLPTLFSGLSTVHVKPAWRMSSTPNGPPISPVQLWEGLRQDDIDGQERGDGLGGGRLYHYGWVRKFGYVLVQRYDADAGTLPSELEPVARTANLELYRVR